MDLIINYIGQQQVIGNLSLTKSFANLTLASNQAVAGSIPATAQGVWFQANNGSVKFTTDNVTDPGAVGSFTLMDGESRVIRAPNYTGNNLALRIKATNGGERLRGSQRHAFARCNLPGVTAMEVGINYYFAALDDQRRRAAAAAPPAPEVPTPGFILRDEAAQTLILVGQPDIFLVVADA